MDMKLASCKGESGSLGPRFQLAVQKAEQGPSHAGQSQNYGTIYS